jgi:hypothetical protein
MALAPALRAGHVSMYESPLPPRGRCEPMACRGALERAAPAGSCVPVLRVLAHRANVGTPPRFRRDAIITPYDPDHRSSKFHPLGETFKLICLAAYRSVRNCPGSVRLSGGRQSHRRCRGLSALAPNAARGLAEVRHDQPYSPRGSGRHRAAHR